MKVTKKSRVTGKTNTLDLDVTQAQLDAHKAGGLAQDVFAHLSIDDREFLITGCTTECWNLLGGGF